ncbi:hypothetical protein NC651_014691 [Populus alba x Populus x berolinensis]|nr:hypothetical protein NC651_014691 [Populus alba x Populus x berolinensis]
MKDGREIALELNTVMLPFGHSVILLSRIHHRNLLVRFKTRRKSIIIGFKRLEIAEDAAKGIEYISIQAKIHIESGDIQGIIRSSLSMWKIAEESFDVVSKPHGHMRPSILRSSQG